MWGNRGCPILQVTRFVCRCYAAQKQSTACETASPTRPRPATRWVRIARLLPRVLDRTPRLLRHWSLLRYGRSLRPPGLLRRASIELGEHVSAYPARRASAHGEPAKLPVLILGCSDRNATGLRRLGRTRTATDPRRCARPETSPSRSASCSSAGRSSRRGVPGESDRRTVRSDIGQRTADAVRRGTADSSCRLSSRGRSVPAFASRNAVSLGTRRVDRVGRRSGPAGLTGRTRLPATDPLGNTRWPAPSAELRPRPCSDNRLRGGGFRGAKSARPADTVRARPG